MRASALRMQRGCHCSLSLRACCITLAAINMLVSVNSFIWSSLCILDEAAHPVLWFHKEISWEEDEQLNSPEESLRFLEKFRDDHSGLLMMALAFDVINVILCLLDVILTCGLIFGAVKGKSAFIRPWLYVGGSEVFYDVAYSVAHAALRVRFSYSVPLLLHIPLGVYLMLVAWNLYLDCKEVERRNAAGAVSLARGLARGPPVAPSAPPLCTPLSLAALIEDGHEDETRSSVPYTALGKDR